MTLVQVEAMILLGCGHKSSLRPTRHSILSAFKNCPLVWLTAVMYRAPNCW